jgi:multiple sugar transport system substrate-binding protein
MARPDRRNFIKAAAVGATAAVAGCMGGDDDGDDDTFRYIFPSYFGTDAEDIVPMFEDEYDVEVSMESSPGEATSTREYYVNQLVGQAGDFNVGNMDIIWPGEFAGNEWALEIEDPEGHTDNMLETPVEAVTIDGTLSAMPLHTDANALYYRHDKLEEHGYDDPPETYMELVDMAQDIIDQDDEIETGYIWQGGTNEGLTIMWFNWLWGMGGDVEEGDEIVVNSQEGYDALQHAVDLIHEYEITPDSVPASDTSDNVEMYQQGETLFMRNWPFAISEMEDSDIGGDYSVAELPTHEDHPDADNACLGGWSVFINAFSGNTELSQDFATFMTSLEVQEHLAREHSRLPVREEVYEDEEIREEFEEMVMLEDILDRTRARPTIEDYPALSEIIFTQANEALTQDKTPEEALDDAQDQIDDDINSD